MNRIILAVIFSFLSSFVVFGQKADTFLRKKNVFLLHSYNYAQVWTQSQAKGYGPYLTSEKYTLYIEDFDEKRLPFTDEIEQTFVEQFNLRYNSVKFDLLVILDNPALSFINKHISELSFLQNLPIIAAGINNYDSLMTANIPKTIILEEKSGTKATLEQIPKFFPSVDTIFCLVDSSMTAQDVKKEIQNYDNLSKQKGEKTKQIVYLFNENDSYAAILERIKKLSKNSVIYVVLYEQDGENKYFSPQSVVKQLLEVTDLPIFCSFDIYMNEGVIGGRVAGGLRVGEYLGWGIVNFFENKETHVCDSTGEKQLEWAFSYPALKKYDISISSLPENSTLYFESSSDLWGNKYLSKVLLILVILVIGIAIILHIFNLQSSKKVKKQVKEIADLFDRLEYLRASMPIGFIELDTELKITYWNESAERIFGYSAKEALGVNLFDLTVAAENRECVDAVVQELFQTSKRFVHSRYIQHKTDISLECEWYFTHKVYPDTDKFYIMCMIIDITERESMKREQENLINALKKMMLNQDSFIATSMHDIKNIMAPISAYSEMLLLQNLPKEKSKDLAEKIYKNITILSDTFVELMNVSKVKGEIIKASPAEFNIRNLSETVSAMLEDHYKRKEINFIDNLPNQLVYADYEMIYSVLINLYGNAIKFTYEKGKVEVSGKVINDKDFEIRIKDNGLGIDIKKFNLMLSENKYFTTKGTAGEEGTGLGLLLCKELIANNHGEFRAENNEDGGSSFYFTLPIKREKN